MSMLHGKEIKIEERNSKCTQESEEELEGMIWELWKAYIPLPQTSFPAGAAD